MSSFQILTAGGGHVSTATTPLRQLRALLPSTTTNETLCALIDALQSTDLLSKCFEHEAAKWDPNSAPTPASASSSISLDSVLTRLATITSSALNAPAHASYGARLAILQLSCDPNSRASEWGTSTLNALLSYGEAASKEEIRPGRGSENAKLAGLSHHGVGELLQAAWVIFGEPAKAESRPEYRRTVVSPNLSRLATAITLLIEAAAKGHSFALSVLPHVVLNIRLHPSIYRPFSPRLHAALTKLVYEKAPSASSNGHPQAVQALISLHWTGHTTGGGTSQVEKAGSSAANLWSATIHPAISAARVSWQAISNTFAPSAAKLKGRNASARSSESGILPTLPKDPHEALPIALERLESMLGSADRSGILSLMLCASTATVVPLPLHELLDTIIIPILSLPSAPEAAPSTDASLQALQTVALPRAQRSALQCLAVLALTVPRAGLASAKNLWRLVDALSDLVSNKDTPSTSRCSASRALALLLCSKVSSDEGSIPGADLARMIDPADPLLLRVATAALSRVSQWLSYPHTGSSPASTLHGSGSNSKSARKRRKYESDDATGSVLVGSAAQDGPRSGKLRLLREDEQATSVACLDILCALSSPLDTDLTPEHRKLSHAAAQVNIALGLLSLSTGHTSTTTSMASDANAQIATGALRYLQHVLNDASSALLSLALAHVPSLATRALQYPHAEVRLAATELCKVLETVTNPRLPPRLARAADERPTEWDADAEVEDIRMVDADEAAQHRIALDAIRSVGLTDDPTRSSSWTPHAVKIEDASQPPGRAAHTQGEDLVDAHFPQQIPSSSAISRTLSQGAPHSSPPLSKAKEDILEPVKPHTRAPTPTMGSPSLVSNRRISISPERVASALGSSNVSATKSRKDVQLASSQTDADMLNAEMSRTASSHSQHSPQLLDRSEQTRSQQVLKGARDSDDDDEAMPTLDLRSSDEESEEE
ncbi:Armadillo-type fold [Ceraceosorus bombacis]|uniref:Armadillo-type fold n=1 Tax=Ceraceosorus bombacis TaxID=401625 RepID=A0A0P1BCQ1_9BASI|nr:Armadillo-type fold [Ceraceosorus bombacis]